MALILQCEGLQQTVLDAGSGLLSFFSFQVIAKIFISCCPRCHLASVSFPPMIKLISLGTEGIIHKSGVSRQDDISGDLPIVAGHGNN